MAPLDRRLTALEEKVDHMQGDVSRILENQMRDHETLIRATEQVKVACIEVDRIRNARLGENAGRWTKAWSVVTIGLSGVLGFIGGLFLWIIKISSEKP